MKVLRIIKLKYKTVEEKENLLIIHFLWRSITFKILSKAIIGEKEQKRLFEVRSPHSMFYKCSRDSDIIYHILLCQKYIELKPFKIKEV